MRKMKRKKTKIRELKPTLKTKRMMMIKQMIKKTTLAAQTLLIFQPTIQIKILNLTIKKLQNKTRQKQKKRLLSKLKNTAKVSEIQSQPQLQLSALLLQVPELALCFTPRFLPHKCLSA